MKKLPLCLSFLVGWSWIIHQEITSKIDPENKTEVQWEMFSSVTGDVWNVKSLVPDQIYILLTTYFCTACICSVKAATYPDPLLRTGWRKRLGQGCWIYATRTEFGVGIQPQSQCKNHVVCRVKIPALFEFSRTSSIAICHFWLIPPSC